MYLSEKIGKDYETWKKGDVIFIESQTGTGKTYFALHELLSFAIDNNSRILYLVNRKILKEQLKAEINKLPAWEGNAICVETYQMLERKMTRLDYNYNGQYMEVGESALEKYKKFDYVICDECHYFLADSNFNTYTEQSYRWIQNNFATKIRIFISATIGEIQEVIECDKKNERSDYAMDTLCMATGAIKEYSMDRDYRDLDIKIIRNRGELAKIIKQDLKNKWLIFVDNIEFGKKIEKEIKNEYSELDVVMLSAGYRYDEEARDEVATIVEKNQQNAQILIATSVMDNGISLEDYGLRNVILMADTEVEFIQMLGRKRMDANKVNIYIYQYNQTHFKKRRDYYMKIKMIADDYYKRQMDGNAIKNPMQVNLELHYWFIDAIFRENIDFDFAKKIFYVNNGTIMLNRFSLLHVTSLVEYYQQVIDLFNSGDEYAFVREQLRWLGKKEEVITDIIEESRINDIEKHKKIIMDVLERENGKSLGRKENLKLKGELHDSLDILIRETTEEQWQMFDGKCSKDSLLSWNAKSESSHEINETQMRFLRDIYNIPYKIKTQRKSKENEETKYEIIKISVESEELSTS